MIRFDDGEYELAAPGGSLSVFICAGKDGRRLVDWMIEGCLSAVGGPVARGDFGGQRMFNFFFWAYGGTGDCFCSAPCAVAGRAAGVHGGAMSDDIPFFLENARCPICGRANGCRMETGEAYKGACWCAAPQISDAAMRRMRDTLPEGRCVCFACLSAIAAEPDVAWSALAARGR